jgi:hypothetical protein
VLSSGGVIAGDYSMDAATAISEKLYYQTCLDTNQQDAIASINDQWLPISL